MDHLHLGISSVLTALSAEAAATCLGPTRILLGLWCLLSTLEWVANAEMFGASGLLSWRVLSLRPGWMFGDGRLLSLVWERSTAWLLGLRIAAAIGLILTPNAGWACLLLLPIISTSWFLTVRTWLATDGADQFGQIASIGALLIASGLYFDRPGVSFAGTLLVGGQLEIAYFFAGITKLLSAEWRDGRALVGIVGTHSYGLDVSARLFGRRPGLARAASWIIIVTETLFPIVLFAPPMLLRPTLTAFLLFHASHAYLMGLNTFPWVFATAYPSFVTLNALTTRALGLS